MRGLSSDRIDTCAVLWLVQKSMRGLALPNGLMLCESEMSRLLKAVSCLIVTRVETGRIGRLVTEVLSWVLKLCAEQHIVLS